MAGDQVQRRADLVRQPAPGCARRPSATTPESRYKHRMKNAAGRHLPAIANLLALEATVRLGSLTEAGNELYLTQSTISKQLSELESFVGVPLLTRAKGAVAATPAGTQYLLRVRRALAEIEDATLEVCAGQGRGGRLSLSVPVSLGNLWLLPRMLDFAKQNPDILLNLISKIGPVACERRRGRSRPQHEVARSHRREREPGMWIIRSRDVVEGFSPRTRRLLPQERQRASPDA